MRTFGADTSHWEGTIDWSKAVEYLPFCYYKATDGISFIDAQFGNNMDGCNEFGVSHSCYHWWQETLNSITQAEHFWNTVQDGGYKRLIVDVEPSQIYGNMYDRLMQLLTRIEQLSGIVPAIYTSANYWNNYIKVNYNNKYPLLVAQYAYRSNPILPMGATNWIIWQFTDQFWFSGCDATADGNWFNGDLAACRNWFGNYHPYNLPPPTSSDEIKPIKYVYVNTEALNMRSLPTVNGLDIGTVKYNDDLGIIEEKDGWLHIEGWISKAYTRPK